MGAHANMPPKKVVKLGAWNFKQLSGDSKSFPKAVRVDAWFSALRAQGIISGEGTLNVAIEPFYNRRDPVWSRVANSYTMILARSHVRPPAQRHSETSLDAAMAAQAGAPALRQQVLALLREKAHTDAELAELLGRSENSVRPRRVELTKMGLVVANGTQRRETGRMANLWRAASEVTQG